MMGMDWADRGSWIRPIILSIIWTAIIVGPIILGLQVFLFTPMTEKLNKIIAENNKKIADELISINSMNCQQLHDKLLNSDHFFDSDNEAIARDHYVAQCGVRLP